MSWHGSHGVLVLQVWDHGMTWRFPLGSALIIITLCFCAPFLIILLSYLFSDWLELKLGFSSCQVALLIVVYDVISLTYYIFLWLTFFFSSLLLSQFDSSCCWDRRGICRILSCFVFELILSRVRFKLLPCGFASCYDFRGSIST